MFKVFFISTIFAISLGANLDRSGRIVGGSVANPGQFAYQAAIRTVGSTEICGGFIINERWVGTSAHCTTGRDTASLIVVVGSNMISNGGTTYAVSQIVAHESYITDLHLNDVAAIQTVNSIVFNSGVAPIGIAANFIGGGITATAAGWGKSFHLDDDHSDILRFINLQTITTADCRARMEAGNRPSHLIFDSSLCTFNAISQGICIGDSGGALVSNNQVIGVISWHASPCGMGYPDVHSRITSFRDWYLRTTQITK